MQINWLFWKKDTHLKYKKFIMYWLFFKMKTSPNLHSNHFHICIWYFISFIPTYVYQGLGFVRPIPNPLPGVLNITLCDNQRWNFLWSDFHIFLSKIFENKMCRIWSKQVGNEGIWAQHRWVSSFFHQWGGSSLILYIYFKNVFIIYSKYGSHQKILFVDFILKIPVIVTSLCRENLMVASPKSVTLWCTYKTKATTV